MNNKQHYEVLIIGAGQAGLATGYYLSKTRQSFAILDASPHVGDSWRNRYDSLVLFSPRSYSSLPGLPLKGEPEDFPSKDEIADYLHTYARHWDLPVVNNEQVVRILKTNDGMFQVITNHVSYTAKQVIVSTGPFHHPSIPAFSSIIPGDILQLHSSHYKNPLQLREGPALVVGGGNSGAQIAVELAQEREVYLSISHKIRFLPLRIGARSMFTLFRNIGIYSATRDSLIGRRLRRQPDPIFGFELRQLIKQRRVHLKPRVNGFSDGKLLFEDHSALSVPNILWSTGFKLNYDWIEIDGVLDKSNNPTHNRGVSPVEGLYFVGLPWQHTRGSALIGGVGKDAEYIVSYVTKRNE